MRHDTTIRHRLAIGKTIKNGNARSIVLGVGTDESRMPSYLLSTYHAYDGTWRRHWVMEIELRDWEEVDA